MAAARSSEQTLETAGSDFPALYVSADGASLAGQRAYTSLVLANLILLVSTAIVAAVKPSQLDSYLPMVSAGALMITLIITFILRARRPERRWYKGRAVAESVKTLSWRYATGADPYPMALSEAEADRKFVADLMQMVRERRDLSGEFADALGNRTHITGWMRTLRGLEFRNRLSTYLSRRIEDQQLWYTTKAKFNKWRESVWTVAVFGLQIAALVMAIVAATSRPPSSAPEALDAASAFAAIASAIIAWTQLKRHHELTQSYTIAALELGLILEQGRHVGNDDELAAFVSDAENAISREHTLWLGRARRMGPDVP